MRLAKKIRSNSKSKLLLTAAAAFAVSMVGIVSAQASECYHHYNDEAWHGNGVAIVFCLNSGGWNYPEDGWDSLPMVDCELRRHDNGEKLLDLYTNPGGTDHDRQIMTDLYTLGTTWTGISVDFVCKSFNDKTYTYTIPDAGYWTPASASDYVCPGPGYLGNDSVCKDDHNPILTVNKTGKGTGTVTGTPGSDVFDTKIDCGSSCTSDKANYQYFSNKKVTLTATPDTGYVFRGWTGGGCSGTGTCVVTMDKDITVSAMFSRPTLVPQNSLLLNGKLK